MLRHLLVLLCILQVQLTFAFTQEYPTGPDRANTPGSLCTHPDAYRYPEHIAYCNRSVTSTLKKSIFENYRKLGFDLPEKNRADYKIDHFFPLCAGGSNNANNLWPQHKTVYLVTDPMEQLGCEKLAAGKITQAELIKIYTLVKNDLSRAAEELKYLQKL